MNSDNKVIDVGTSSVKVMPDNPKRIWALLQNDHASQVIYLKLRSEAVSSEGIKLAANGGAYEINRSNPWTGEVYGIASGATTRLMITEVSL